MLIIILGGIGVILFVLGISFAFRGYLAVPNENTVVPRQEHEALKKTLSAAQESERTANNELTKVKSELESTRTHLASSQTSEEAIRTELEKIRLESEEMRGNIEKQLTDAIVSIESLKAENDSLKTHSESFGDRINPLKQELSLAQEKAVEQAKGALEIIDSLKAQISVLKANEATHLAKINELESQAEGATTKSQEDLTKIQEELVKAQKEIEELRALSDSSEKNNDAGQSKISELTDKLTTIEGEHKSQLEIALKAVDSLKTENQQLKNDNEKFKSESELLKSENESLKAQAATPDTQQGADAEELKKLQELNAQLTEKEQAAQYELAKSRAQASGLEKICADFKAKFETIEQLEMQLREAQNKVEALQEENAELKNKPVV